MKIQESLMFDTLTSTIKNVLSGNYPVHYDSMENKALDIKNTPVQNEIEIVDTLTRIGALGFNVPLALGGTDLGENVTSMMCKEAGYHLFNYPYLSVVGVNDILMLSQKKHQEKVKQTIEDKLSIGLVYFPTNSLIVNEVQNPVMLSSKYKIFVTHFDKFDEILINYRESYYLISKYKLGLTWTEERKIGNISCYSLYLENLELNLEECIDLDEKSNEYIQAKLRLRQASYLLGLSNGAMNEVIKYVNLRKQFDKKLIDNQSISFKLASLVAQLNAAEHKIRSTISNDMQHKNITSSSIQSLALISELALEISRESLHFHGAFGMTEYSLIEKYFRLISIESIKYGVPNDLWLESGLSIMENFSKK